MAGGCGRLVGVADWWVWQTGGCGGWLTVRWVWRVSGAGGTAVRRVWRLGLVGVAGVADGGCGWDALLRVLCFPPDNSSWQAFPPGHGTHCSLHWPPPPF